MNVVLVGLIRLVELLFFVGCCGSILVILLSGIEDVETIFRHNEETGLPPMREGKQS